MCLFGCAVSSCCTASLVVGNGGYTLVAVYSFHCGGFSYGKAQSRTCELKRLQRFVEAAWYFRTDSVAVCPGLVFHSMWNLPWLGIESCLLHFIGESFTTEPPGKLHLKILNFHTFPSNSINSFSFTLGPLL